MYNATVRDASSTAAGERSHTISTLILVVSFTAFLVLAALLPTLTIRASLERKRLLIAACVAEFVAIAVAIVPFFVFDYIPSQAAIGVILAVPTTVAFSIVVPALFIAGQPSRTLQIGALSFAVFIAVSIPVYWTYAAVSDGVFDEVTREGQATLEALFYTALTLHLLVSFGLALLVIFRLRAAIIPTSAVVFVQFAVLTLPLLVVLSGLNDCVHYWYFPLPGDSSCGD